MTKRDPPYDGGSQPVVEQPPEVPTAGRSVLRTVVIGLGVLVILAALAWAAVLVGA